MQVVENEMRNPPKGAHHVCSDYIGIIEGAMVLCIQDLLCIQDSLLWFKCFVTNTTVSLNSRRGTWNIPPDGKPEKLKLFIMQAIRILELKVLPNAYIRNWYGKSSLAMVLVGFVTKVEVVLCFPSPHDLGQELRWGTMLQDRAPPSLRTTSGTQ